MKIYKIEVILNYPYNTVSTEEYDLYDNSIEKLLHSHLYCSYGVSVETEDGKPYTHLRFKVYTHSLKLALNDVLNHISKQSNGLLDEYIDEILIGKWWHEVYDE